MNHPRAGRAMSHELMTPTTKLGLIAFASAVCIAVIVLVTLSMALLKPADRNANEMAQIQKNVVTGVERPAPKTSFWYFMWELFLNALVLAIFLSLGFVVVWFVKVSNDWTWTQSYQQTIASIRSGASNVAGYFFLAVSSRPRLGGGKSGLRRCAKCGITFDSAIA